MDQMLPFQMGYLFLSFPQTNTLRSLHIESKGFFCACLLWTFSSDEDEIASTVSVLSPL